MSLETFFQMKQIYFDSECCFTTVLNIGPSEGFEPSSSGFFLVAPLGALAHSRLY